MPELVEKNWSVTVKLDAEDLSELMEMVSKSTANPNGHQKWWQDEIAKWRRKQ